MHNVILNLIESFNDYLLFNFSCDVKAFHKDCDNKGILFLKTFNFLRLNLSDYAQQFRSK